MKTKNTTSLDRNAKNKSFQTGRLEIRQYLVRFAEAVAAPIDSDDLKLQKALIVAASILIMVAGLLWGTLYLAFGELIAGAIPIAYSTLSLVSLAVFLRTRRYEPYRISQLVLILLLPFFLMIALGGFVNSSAVILWSILCPLGALLFAREKNPPLWMLLYLGLVVIGGFIQPHMRESNNLPPALVTPIFFILNLGVVSGIAFVLLFYFVRERERTYGLLRVEQLRSEELLLNVLPGEIAPRLKGKHEIIADYHAEASVLFADIVESTAIFAQIQPDEAVDWLNEVFTRFDRLVDRYNLEKIRTVGDNYMVASGAPRPAPDHAGLIARLGLAMTKEIEGITPRHGMKLNIRVGINSGALVAGVIGTSKFHYDVWGDTVNIASRMESQGVPGKVQITDNTYRLIKDTFICEPRGPIEVKGKGRMNTWFLIGASS
ncbi:MAG: adenylate/guanylate cyclase domain-containing protein [Anaerolineales bacterium]|nr:adenylate/guanylate cyclase domain-containing protein [Anaerolineales bacterium]